MFPPVVAALEAVVMALVDRRWCSGSTHLLPAGRGDQHLWQALAIVGYVSRRAWSTRNELCAADIL
jgi:hypothetical protein